MRPNSSSRAESPHFRAARSDEQTLSGYLRGCMIILDSGRGAPVPHRGTTCPNYRPFSQQNTNPKSWSLLVGPACEQSHRRNRDGSGRRGRRHGSPIQQTCRTGYQAVPPRRSSPTVSHDVIRAKRRSPDWRARSQKARLLGLSGARPRSRGPSKNSAKGSTWRANPELGSSTPLFHPRRESSVQNRHAAQYQR